MFSKRAALTVACLVCVVLPAGASSTGSGAPQVSLASFEPNDGAGIWVERVTSVTQGAPETWFLSADIQIRNDGAQRLQLKAVDLAYPGSSVPPTSIPFDPLDKSQWILAGKSRTFRLADTRRFPMPNPPNFEASFRFIGFDTPYVFRQRLVEWKPKAPGGYIFPARREDLQDGEYWLDDETHFPGSGHYGTQPQRFAYDLKVFRWSGSEWTHLRAGTDGTKNADYLVWKVPVYAMADGWVLRCVADVPDNSAPGVKGSAGGNGYWIVHANGEIALYAHLRKGTVKPELCPRSRVNFATNKIRVMAGQLLGQVGNSGQSSNPHLHIHLETTATSAGQGRPFHFRRLRTMNAGSDLKSNPPCTPISQSFATTNGAAPGPAQLIDPLLQLAHREYMRYGVEDTCADALFSAYSAAGYSITWFDGFDAGGKTYFSVVFRPDGPKWRYRFGLTSSQFQAELEQAVSDGYRPTHVESYLRSGGARFAFVAEKRSGPPYRVYHDRPAAHHEQLVDELSAAGLRPVNVAVVSVAGSLRYTALWEKRSIGSWKLASTIRTADYQKWLDDQARAGRRLVYTNGYSHGGRAYLVAIVSSAASPTYEARHGLTPQQYQSEYTKWVNAGRSTRAVTGYVNGGHVRYAALWR
jgi:hypothetical protein